MKALLGALLGTSLLSPAFAQDPAVIPAQQTVPPIQEEGDFYILNFSEDPAQQLTLQDFVKLCQEATGVNFTYDQQTGQALNDARAVMFGPKRIPKSEFYNFFQIQLFINEFVCVEVGPPQISVVLIQSLAQTARGQQTIKQKALYVLPQDLDDYIDQPATLITTVLNLKNIETRTLQAQLRALFPDTTTQSIIPATEHSLILQGFGSYIASLARLLQLVDDVSAATDEVQPVFDLIPLEFAAAEDVADLLEQLLEAQRDRIAQRPRVTPEGQGVSGALQGAGFEAKIL
ncbi:MAG: hypothetical protein L0191_14685, partial [Acidobacteria bacterium]|nr:hypothetical protein [Acidobacteriota bacterium]